MVANSFAYLVLSGVLLGQQPPSNHDDYYAGVASAGKELANQMDFVNRALATIPGPTMGRGLYKQTNRIMIDLIYFRQQVQRKASRDDLLLAFTTVDGELNQLLTDLQGFEKWDPSVRMSARRAQTALHDLEFALATGLASPGRLPQAIARQTQALQNREADLESMVGLVLYEPDALKDWNADFASLRGALAELQRLEKKKSNLDDLQKQFVQTDKIWEKLVGRFQALNKDQTLQLREDFGQVDQCAGRLAVLLGIQNRRAPLRTNFLQ